MMGETQKASTTAEQLFNISGNPPQHYVPKTNKAAEGEHSGSSQLKLAGSLGKGGLPSQVIEMNENVRELVIDAPL